MKANWVSYMVICCMGLILFLIGYIFWIEEYQYSFYDEPADLQIRYSDFQYSTVPITLGRPIYLHFYDPDCKYSRVNIDHIAPVLDQYVNEIDYFILIKGEVNEVEFKQLHKIPDHVNIINDPSMELYSKLEIDRTPKVAIIDADFQLYYSGNYTIGLAFCGVSNIQNSNPATALDFLIKNNKSPIFPAVKSYTCKI